MRIRRILVGFGLFMAVTLLLSSGDLQALSQSTPMPEQGIGHISNGSGAVESDIKALDFGGTLLARFRTDQITPGTREVVAIAVAICDGGTLANTQVQIQPAIVSGTAMIAGGLAAIPCISLGVTDGLATGVNGAVLTFAGPLARFMGTVRMYADIDFDGILFETGELVAQTIPTFNEGTGEAIAQFGGRQGQMLFTSGGVLIAVPDPTAVFPFAPLPLILIFTVDIDSSAPGGRVDVALGLQVGDDTAQGAFGICASAAPFFINCGSNLMGSGPETDSFTVVGAGGGTTPGPGPSPGPPAGGLQQFDQNGNCLIDDPEFFTAVERWVNGQIDNSLFFDLIDAWIQQTNVCTSGSSVAPVSLTLRATSQGVAFQAQAQAQAQARGSGVAKMSVRIYDLQGRTIWRGEAAGSQLVWMYRTREGLPVTNGVYLYEALLRDESGQILHRQIRKLTVLR